METTEVDDRIIHNCFRAVKCPDRTFERGAVCCVCGNTILLGVVFAHGYCPDQARNWCELFTNNVWVLRHDFCKRNLMIVLCSICFLPEVELCHFPGESEQQQFDKISLEASQEHKGGIPCHPKFKRRLKVNKSKSSRKLADQ